MPLLLFVLYPIVEIWLWSLIITQFGWGDAFLWCLTSALVGMYVIKLQGTGVVQEFQRVSQKGEMPSSRIVHRIVMSFGGFLLVLPGVLTDVLGALLILPGVRHLLIWFFYWKIAKKLFSSGGMVFRFGSFGASTVFRSTRGPEFSEAPPSEPRDVTESGAQVIDITSRSKKLE